MDIKALKENFGSEWVLLVKRHGFVKKEWDIPEDCQDFAFDITEHMPIEDLLFTADMCITDYSSLIFEYSLFERPMIFYAFDLDEFYDYRGFYYPYDYSFLPGPIVKTNEELINAIKQGKADPTVISDFRERFMGACDGRSTERIADYIMSQNSEY